jgi:6-pyruvoyltetrahydropterin/6-carboxytetrahydropterin synthase
VVEPFDHTFLNKDIPYFADVVPTAENIAVHIRDLLQHPIRDIGAQLYKIKLIESPNNSCEVFCTEADFNQAAGQQREAILAKS